MTHPHLMTPPPRLVPDRPSDAERNALIATLRTMLKSSEPQTDAETGEDNTMLPMPVESFDRTMRIAILHLEAVSPPVVYSGDLPGHKTMPGFITPEMSAFLKEITGGNGNG